MLLYFSYPQKAAVIIYLFICFSSSDGTFPGLEVGLVNVVFWEESGSVMLGFTQIRVREFGS